MKDLEEKAKEYAEEICKTDPPQYDDFQMLKTLGELRRNAEEDFIAGYTEAMKEQREFYLKVSSYMMELELYLSKTGESDYILLESLHTDVLKHLSSFTEQEQSTK
jgi:hypothetical protein